MRLLEIIAPGEFRLTRDIANNIEPYAILSHTWGKDEEEVSFRDLENRSRQQKIGYEKIRLCGEQAARDGLRYFWVDTCCIDKSSSAELTEAINSMFNWYQKASRCYVYLADVPAADYGGNDPSSEMWETAFLKSRWFTRGWTLQELVAPDVVEFFSQEWKWLGNKSSLAGQIRDACGVPVETLREQGLSSFSINERMQWAANRTTTRPEDKAYSLLGIFGVYMPLLYGEGELPAFSRLRREIDAFLGSSDASEDREGISFADFHLLR